MKFKLKQYMKMALQNLILPIVYKVWRIVYRKCPKRIILFADAHHSELPFSMEVIHEEVLRRGYRVVDVFCDYGKLSPIKSALEAIRFMRLYAQARCVFICDYFLPVTSCKKDPATTVVQLWHGCGLMKKMGYDTTEDIPKGYYGKVYRNYDLFTVSSKKCEPIYSKATQLPQKVVQGIGVSRTDRYFDVNWLDSCRREFYALYPQYVGKKIILWAPTFRGNASDPYQVGTAEIAALEKQLGDNYVILRKMHPHIDSKKRYSNCSIPTERLLPVTDLLITDYSTVLTDYLFFRKPYLLFAPDIDQYLVKRGFYVRYNSLCPYIVTDPAELQKKVEDALADRDLSWIDECSALHISACDGNSTVRIIRAAGL